MADHALLTGKKEKDTRECDIERSCKIRVPGLVRESTLKFVFLSATIGLIFLKVTKACNILIFMDHDKVSMTCDKSGCMEHAQSFTVRKGYEICLEDHLRERISLNVSDIIWRLRYERAYYTQDYRVDMESASSECDFKRGNIDYMELCYQRAVNQLPENTDNETIERIFEFLPAGGCMCVHTARSEGIDDLFSVLQLRNRIAVVKLTVQDTSNNTHEIEIGEDEKTHFFDVSKFKLNESGLIPFTVLNSAAYVSPTKSLLHFNDTFYHVTSSLPDIPDSDLIGDYQIDEAYDVANYVRPDIECDFLHDNCSCSCKVDQVSAISKFGSEIEHYSEAKSFTMRASDYSVVDTYDETLERGEVYMQVGNYTSDPRVMAGRCTIEVVGSYGCSSCDDSAHVALKATNIEKEGLIPFRSNCTFDRRSVKCDFDPTKLILHERHDACYIRIQTAKLNEFTIQMKYIDFGQNGAPHKEVNCIKDFPEHGAILNLVANSRFVGTFVGTIIACCILTSLLILLIRFVREKRSLSYKVWKEPNLLNEP